MKCPKCNSPISDEMLFCPSCGASLSNSRSTNKPTSYLKYIITGVVLLVLAVGCYFAFQRFGGKTINSVSTDSLDVADDQFSCISIDDLIKFQETIALSSNKFTEEAKAEYELNKPVLQEIAEKYGLDLYEYHYVNGDLGEGEMSTYEAYLYKNCKIEDSEIGPQFTSKDSLTACVISSGSIRVFCQENYSKVLNQLKEECGEALMDDELPDGPEPYYSNGTYRFYPDKGSYTIFVSKY